MNAPQFTNPAGVYLEITQTALKALYGDAGLEMPLERTSNGRLTLPCRTRLTQALQNLVQRKSWQPKLRAYCAIGARGVTFRRLALPPAAKDELQKVLLLQIENEFPIAPEELAWGYRLLNSVHPAAGAAPPQQQEALVAAVKKDAVEEYTEVLAACGLQPVFVVAAQARSELRPAAALGACVLLELGLTQSEWVEFENDVPVAVRVLPWGSEKLAQLVAAESRVSQIEADRMLHSPEASADPASVERVRIAVAGSLDTLAAAVNGRPPAQRLFLTGEHAFPVDLPAQLSQRLGGVPCERVEVAVGEGRSAAVLGLKQAIEVRGGAALLMLQVKATTNGGGSASRPMSVKWAKIAAALVLAAILLPYAEAAILKPFLSRRITALKADQSRLTMIDHEFEFLKYLKKNQPPYLDVLYLIAKSSPGGVKLESVTMNRRGELSFRAPMQNGQQVSDFRSKLLDSGFFTTVVVEEQVPTPDRQRVNVRITAMCKAVETRPAVKVEPIKPGERPPSGMGMPPGEMPPGMMPSGPKPVGAVPAGLTSPPGMNPPPGVMPPGAMPTGSLPPDGAPVDNPSPAPRPRPQPTSG